MTYISRCCILGQEDTECDTQSIFAGGRVGRRHAALHPLTVGFSGAALRTAVGTVSEEQRNLIFGSIACVLLFVTFGVPVMQAIGWILGSLSVGEWPFPLPNFMG